MIRRTAVGAMAAALALATVSPSDAKRRKTRRKGGDGVQAAASFDPFTLNVATRPSPATVGDEDVCIVTGENGTVTLPDATAFPGRVIFVGTDPWFPFVTVEDIASAPCAVISDGTRWNVIGRN
jgi:hypothetical protein